MVELLGYRFLYKSALNNTSYIPLKHVPYRCTQTLDGLRTLNTNKIWSFAGKVRLRYKGASSFLIFDQIKLGVLNANLYHIYSASDVYKKLVER